MALTPFSFLISLMRVSIFVILEHKKLPQTASLMMRMQAAGIFYFIDKFF